jgi:hypothetical protein
MAEVVLLMTNHMGCYRLSVIGFGLSLKRINQVRGDNNS